MKYVDKSSKRHILSILIDLKMAVDAGTYVPQTPTPENPALSDDYVFDTDDENAILKDLTREHFGGKVVDVGKGAKKRLARGYQQEYLYIFKYPCVLWKREAELGDSTENVLIYIKINNRKVPNEKVCVVSFHKNRTKNR